MLTISVAKKWIIFKDKQVFLNFFYKPSAFSILTLTARVLHRILGERDAQQQSPKNNSERLRIQPNDNATLQTPNLS